MANTNEILKDTITDTQSNLENCSEEEYFKKLYDVFNGTKIPDDFDSWTAQEQCDWKSQEIKRIFPEVPKSLQDVISGGFQPIVSCPSQGQLPKWLDKDKYCRGQKLVANNYVSIVLCHILAIAYAATFDDGVKGFILGGNIHTPYLSFERYLGTIKRILAWYDGEPWIKGTQAHKAIQTTHAKHLAISTKLASFNHQQINTASKITNPWCPERELLLKDFATCPLGKLGQRPYKLLNYIPDYFRPKNINNADMSVVQAIIIIIPLFKPQHIGLHGATDDDLEAFCHMWRYYGYLLGIKDEYNFCRGSLQQIKQRAWEFTQKFLIPNFKDIEADGLHLIRCTVEALNYFPLVYAPAKIVMLYFTEALNLNMPNLYASLSYGEWIVYKFYMFMLRHAFKFSAVRKFGNRLLFKILKTASNFGPEKLMELHEKSTQQIPDFPINF